MTKTTKMTTQQVQQEAQAISHGPFKAIPAVGLFIAIALLVWYFIRLFYQFCQGRIRGRSRTL